jgi:hypothetical protein
MSPYALTGDVLYDTLWAYSFLYANLLAYNYIMMCATEVDKELPLDCKNLYTQ